MFGGWIVAPLTLIEVSAVLTLLVVLRLGWLVQEKEKARRQISAREEFFRVVIQHAGDVICVTDREGDVLYRAGQADLSVAEGGDLPWAGDVHPQDHAGARAAFAEALHQPGKLVQAEMRARHIGGAWSWLEVRLVNLLEAPNVGGVVVALRDMTERRAVEDELRHNAFHDPLTGLPNRALLADRIDQAVLRGRRGNEVAVLFIDLDNFKTINDSLGHLVGDQVLCVVADRFEAAIRPGDTIARLGGDEFAVLMEHVSDRAVVSGVAERLVAMTASPVVIGFEHVPVSASIGIAIGTIGETTTGELLRHSDAAMYTAKAQAKGSAEIFDSEADFDQRTLGRLEMELDLRHALERDRSGLPLPADL